jgi:predicted RNA-binding protein with PIN domain
MPLLIDGHNLIGQLQGLRLDDPDDEAKLVQQLKGYAARNRKRITVVFDQGLPGGKSLGLSGGGVSVVFASPGRSADGILVERIRGVSNPRGLIVVSSDRRVVAAAQAHGARVVRAEEFAEQMEMPVGAEDDSDVRLSADEVAHWLQVFKRRERKR